MSEGKDENYKYVKEIRNLKIRIGKGGYGNPEKLKEDLYRLLMVRSYGYIDEYVNILKQQLDQSLDEIHANRKNKINVGRQTSLSKEIKKKIKIIKGDNIIDSEGESAVYKGKKYSFEILIDHPLAVALNDGTGIYGVKKRPITAKNKRYMFIPESGFTVNRGQQISSYKTNLFRQAIKKQISRYKPPTKK